MTENKKTDKRTKEYKQTQKESEEMEQTQVEEVVETSQADVHQKLKELEELVKRQQEELSRRDSAKQGGKPITIKSGMQRTRMANQKEVAQMLSNPKVKQCLIDLFNLAPKHHKYLDREKRAEAQYALEAAMLEVLRTTGVDFSKGGISVIGREDMFSTPKDRITILFSAPVVVMSPLKNEGPISGDKDRYLLQFKFDASMVLPRESFDSYLNKRILNAR